MRFILNNIKFVFRYFYMIFFLSVFSCADEEIKPFVGEKIVIYESSKLNASDNFFVNIDQVSGNNYWVQKGGNDNHLIPNINLKIPFNSIKNRPSSVSLKLVIFPKQPTS